MNPLDVDVNFLSRTFVHLHGHGEIFRAGNDTSKMREENFFARFLVEGFLGKKLTVLLCILQQRWLTGGPCPHSVLPPLCITPTLYCPHSGLPPLCIAPTASAIPSTALTVSRPQYSRWVYTYVHVNKNCFPYCSC